MRTPSLPVLLLLGAAQAGQAQTRAGTGTAASAETLAALERGGAVIGGVTIDVGNVFDLRNPAEDRPLYRAANRFHMTTRPSVVEDILLFEPGDPFSLRLLEESERLLRGRGFVADASVDVTGYDAQSNEVDVAVQVRDAWSFKPDLRLGRGGGENRFGIGISESNLVGTGKELTVSFRSDVDRDETFVSYLDPNVFGGRTRLQVVTSDNSDGYRHLLAAERPFFALDTRWATGGRFLKNRRVQTIYDLGEEIDEFRHTTRHIELEGGFSRGLIGNRARRWLAGIAYEEDRFAPSADLPMPLLLPADRKLLYPWIGFQLIEDEFREMTQVNDIGRVEDVFIGLDLQLKVGFASEGAGSDRDATLFEASVHKGWEPGGHLLLFDAQASGRREDDGLRNGLLHTSLRYFHRNLERHLFLVSLDTLSSDALDAENQVLLGGDNGLRGYPLRYQTGEHRAVLTLEQRFFTDWYPFRLFRVGSAVFLDAGRTWGRDSRGSVNHGTLYDVGVGVRLSSPRASGKSVVHIDLAFPLNGDSSIDNVQLLVETKATF